MCRGLAVVLIALPLLALSGPHQVPRGPSYARVYVLKPKEGVFAYARISPDGRSLIYASETIDPRRNGANEDITLVDLATRRILFSETGKDAYWSIDGKRIIYSRNGGVVTIRNNVTGVITPHVAPLGLGDYYSWAVRDGRDLIMTITGNFYYLDGDTAVMPIHHVDACAGIGATERPLISKDGKRVTTFADGNVVVRGVDNCDDIFNTGIKGAKADFSWDGRYIAFHALKREGSGYEIKIVDLEQRTVRTLPGLEGSALFPSWTRDGRLCFRYDGPDYRGFVIATGVLDVAAKPLPSLKEPLQQRRRWSDIFPETPRSASRVQVALIWAPWSAHTREAFSNLEDARKYFAQQAADISIAAAPDPTSREIDIAHELSAYHVTIPRLDLSARGLAITEARNQMPTILLFSDGILVDRRLGAQPDSSLRMWIGAALKDARHHQHRH